MGLHLSDEQQLLGASVSALLAKHSGSSAWQGFAELGLLAMPFRTCDGGLESSFADMMVVMTSIGRARAEAPFLASAVIGSKLLDALATPQQRAAIVPGLIGGSELLGFAHAEPGSRFELARVGTRAVRVDGGYVLSGTKVNVIGGAHATQLLITARTAGGDDDTHGVSLFLAPRDASAMVVGAAGPDGAVDVVMHGLHLSEAARLGAENEALAAVDSAVCSGVAGSIADATGAMETVLALTVEHLRTRRQFGVAIGSFQSLQHKLVDLFMEVEQAKSMSIYATSMLDAEPAIRRQATAAAKANVNAAARLVGETAVQLFGAFGLTVESPVAQLFRRLTAFQLMFGDRDQCLHILGQFDTSILEA